VKENECLHLLLQAQSVLGLVQDGFSLLIAFVARTGAESVAGLLTGALVAFRLNALSDAVHGSADLVTDLFGAGLLGIGLDGIANLAGEIFAASVRHDE